MATPAQTLANQLNAQLSTGPLSPDGKQTSSQNAQKHGLGVSTATLRREEADQYATLLAELTAQFRPADSIVRAVVEELATAMLRLRRCRTLEAHLLDSAEDLTSAFPHLDKIDRYRRAAERTFYRCLHELSATLTPALPARRIPTQDPVVQNEPNPGRNSPCPCNSGRKFKQCCLGNPAKSRPTGAQM